MGLYSFLGVAKESPMILFGFGFQNSCFGAIYCPSRIRSFLWLYIQEVKFAGGNLISPQEGLRMLSAQRRRSIPLTCNNGSVCCFFF